MAAKFGKGKTWLVNVVFCCFFLFSVFMTMAGRATGAGSNVSSIQTHEIQKLLKKLNRPAVKSIKSPDGDIVDCVHVSNQPAFDHPALKNHTIQMKPNSKPKRTHEESKVSPKWKPIAQLWHQSGRCPEGTIPVKRTREGDILRASSVQQFGKKPLTSAPTNHEYAIAFVNGDMYYGTEVSMNVWKPIVQQPNEFSLSQLWITSGSYENQDLNTIEAGWQVYPEIYGDDNTRLFIYWTTDAYNKTGCYNLKCSGFIQTSNEIVLGGSLSPVSSYDGSQVEMTIRIWKDPGSGNWWMLFNDNQTVGYWPASLFSHLSDSASMVEWGGEIVNLQSGGQHTTTQMGSGHFPEEGYGKASYFKNIQLVNGNNQLVPASNIITQAEQFNCYNIQTGYSADWGNYFFYGGPGRNPNCP